MSDLPVPPFVDDDGFTDERLSLWTLLPNPWPLDLPVDDIELDMYYLRQIALPEFVNFKILQEYADTDMGRRYLTIAAAINERYLQRSIILIDDLTIKMAVKYVLIAFTPTVPDTAHFVDPGDFVGPAELLTKFNTVAAGFAQWVPYRNRLGQLLEIGRGQYHWRYVRRVSVYRSMLTVWAVEHHIAIPDECVLYNELTSWLYNQRSGLTPWQSPYTVNGDLQLGNWNSSIPNAFGEKIPFTKVTASDDRVVEYKQIGQWLETSNTLFDTDGVQLVLDRFVVISKAGSPAQLQVFFRKINDPYFASAPSVMTRPSVYNANKDKVALNTLSLVVSVQINQYTVGQGISTAVEQMPCYVYTAASDNELEALVNDYLGNESFVANRFKITIQFDTSVS